MTRGMVRLMRELKQTISSSALTDPNLPLLLRFVEAVDPVLPNASATNQEMESNPQYENSPQGPTMRPWRTFTDNGKDANQDFHED